jgi:hypothetical protein
MHPVFSCRTPPYIKSKAMKGWILLVIALFLLQAASIAASSSFVDGDLEGVPDDDDDIETLYLVINMLLYNIMLITQLLLAEGEWLDSPWSHLI